MVAWAWCLTGLNINAAWAQLERPHTAPHLEYSPKKSGAARSPIASSVCKMGPFGLQPALIAISLLCLKAAHAQFLAFGSSAGDIDLLASENNSTELQVDSLPGFRISNSLYKTIFVSYIF